MTLKHLLISLGLISGLPMAAQEVEGFVHEASEADEYVWPTDSAVRQKLETWQDLKFGVLLHWGLYSVPGIVESWSICSEDVDWISRKNNLPYDRYKEWYWGLKDSLNPTRFNPSQWADAIEKAGANYMIFTTKHHDGFCTFNSRYTDFSIANGPFAKDSLSNVAYHVFEAFRKKQMMIGCYFSKPDWHCPWFWNPNFATPNRHINYKKERHPNWWADYQEFTRNQLHELMSDYGHFDILWLDGGWVKGDEIGLDEVLERARVKHPGLIAVDRTIRGKNENYQTPERSIPERQMNHPWESCIPLSNDWGWVPNAAFKSPQKVVALLAEIVAKGGCFLLGVGPTADGLIEDEVVKRLSEVGNWLRTNGKAIYHTRTTPHYCEEGRLWFTADKDGKTLYAIYAPEDGENLPSSLEWTVNLPQGRMILLNTGARLNYAIANGKVTVNLPRKLKNEPLAIAFTRQ